MKVGDLVTCHRFGRGVVVGFNKPGEGGKDFIHVLCETGEVIVFMSFDVEVLSSGAS